ncbi:putative O-glycosylation ligase, exosortase A system-associated [Deferrisoma camini]|uniref:putative O-glycosylation ligase, exosortase A system-associated n=1 Tax=Deferrisoma camini TaxID=1035120 RepID=UPI00046CFBD8|nr:putative O-glycosylation ligase, exosortase A system-associated [Deferrisoma camini]
MPIRDAFVALVLFAGVPVAFFRPVWGVLLYAMFGYLNPHRLTWGFAQNLPVAFYTALATMAGWVFYSGDRRLPVTREVILMGLLWGLASVGWLTALNPQGFVADWSRYSKILLMIFVAVSLIKTREDLRRLYWVIALSIGFYALKGAIWGMRGGTGWVFGPPGSFFEGNNGLGLAINMVWPLFLLMARNERRPWLRLGLWLLFWVSPLTVILTKSRASALAMAVVGAILFLRVKRKGLFIVLGVTAALVLAPFVPAEWYTRMKTVETYREDPSAMGRINAWHAAWNLAVDRPLTGGGMNAFTREMIFRYAPNPEDYHDSHSIYFEILGELGFPGLAVFLVLLLSTMAKLNKIKRVCAGNKDLAFFESYADATFLGLVGYAVNGAFVGMAYFDLYYQLVGLTVSLETVLTSELWRTEDVSSSSYAPATEVPAMGSRWRTEI